MIICFSFSKKKIQRTKRTRLIKREKTVRNDENVEKDVDDENERRNLWRLVSRKDNLASLLCTLWPSEQRYEPLSLGRDATICRTVTVAFGNSVEIVILVPSETTGLPSTIKIELFY